MSTNKTSSEFKVVQQTREVLAYSGLVTTETLYVQVTGAPKFGVLNYKWEVNKNDNRGWVTHTSTSRNAISVDIQDNISTMQNWTFRCTVKDVKSSASVTSEDIKFTIVPKEGRWINVTQPIASKTVNGGEEITLTTYAKGISSYSGKEIGYQWFEYDSSVDEFTKINGATNNTYTFKAPYYTTQQTKKYVCRYCLKNAENKYLSESNQSIITINKSQKEKIEIKELKATKVGNRVNLQVKATSTLTDDLKYQWYKVSDDGINYKKIDDANTANYSYDLSSANSNNSLTFMVMVVGVIQDELQNYFQSANVEVQSVASNEVVLPSTLKVSSSVVTNQASVRSTFYPITRVTGPWYKVEVEGASASELAYKWYYVGRSGKKYLIENATENGLTPTKDLFEKAYKENSYHKVGIMCEVYQNGKLVKTVDQSTNNMFYMNVVINNRR